MDQIMRQASEASLVPVPRVGMTTRLATMDDLSFIDGLQKQYSKQLGFFPRAQMLGYIENQWMLIAEDAASGAPIGYCASRDRYLKRDELGVIYQLCVAPGHQRSLVGASLIQSVFKRSAYGCRLYCCWCAQDLAANYFWESLGFVPIAFRAGSTGKKRVHIFWQKRINDGDEQTAWWYPFQTNAGAIREDRIVFPIPPGTHWREVKAVMVSKKEVGGRELEVVRSSARSRERRPTSHHRQPTPLPASSAITSGGLHFAVLAPAPSGEKTARPAKVKTPAAPIDPKYLAAARELRDRWMERVNTEGLALEAASKYDLSRRLAAVDGGGAEAGNELRGIADPRRALLLAG